MAYSNPRYPDTIKFLFSQLAAFEREGLTGYKPGLERVLALEEAFGNPHCSLRTIHVAGTNGKGSTSHTLAAILQSAGYRTGLFTSPHLIDFRERIKVNGEMIPEDEVVDFTDRFREMNLGISPSFFELTTTLAFEYFKKQKVDIAVIEVGLGGRLDSTNIVSPDLGIITNISLDHTSMLGNTRALIAAEKAGIIKAGMDVVIGDDDEEVRPVFDARAREMDARVVYARQAGIIESYETRDGIPYYKCSGYGWIKGDLRGDYQRDNAAVILSAVHELRKAGFKIDDDAVKSGFSNVCGLTGLMGRWMTVSENPYVVCDTGHNTGGWRYLAPQINRLPGKKHLVIGFVDDKDVKSILDMIASEISDCCLYFTQPDNHRALSANELKSLAEASGLKGSVESAVSAAYEKALAGMDKGDSMFVGGSSYVVADFLVYLRKLTSQR